MTRDTCGRILRPHTFRIEPRPVGTEAESARHGRVARGAIALGVAGGAGLEALPRGLPVSEAEAAEGVVVSRAAERGLRDETRLLVTVLAELRRIVAIAAVRLT